MGYCTNYILEIVPNSTEAWMVLAQPPISEQVTFDSRGHCDEQVKWYGHEADMLEVSRQFPDLLFTLRGDGESSGDIWVKYFKRGKVQESKAQIILAAFDEKLLR